MYSHTVAIIGSFQKFYDEVNRLISFFNENGVTVTSPYKSKIIATRSQCNGSGFVVFAADDASLNDAEIQMETLQKILKAEAVYVYNPDGYVGRTTCYEIGVLIAMHKPIYFLEEPKDLPIPFSVKQIIIPEVFVEMVKGRNAHFEMPSNLSGKGLSSYRNVFCQTKQSLVVCGSMQFYAQMKELKARLENIGIQIIIPANEDEVIQTLEGDDLDKFKRQVSNAYLRKIRDKHTLALLIVNEEKRGIKNYIGANTLVEIGMAFSWGKKVFILNDFYEPLRDELRAWECEALKGDLTNLVDYFMIKEGEKGVCEKQITMFDCTYELK